MVHEFISSYSRSKFFFIKQREIYTKNHIDLKWNEQNVPVTFERLTRGNPRGPRSSLRRGCGQAMEFRSCMCKNKISRDRSIFERSYMIFWTHFIAGLPFPRTREMSMGVGSCLWVRWVRWGRWVRSTEVASPEVVSGSCLTVQKQSLIPMCSILAATPPPNELAEPTGVYPEQPHPPAPTIAHLLIQWYL